MKATGIVRRIDDLGRVVLPKEIRKTMRIREGDPLEIYTDSSGSIIFKKYSQLGENTEVVRCLCRALHKALGLPCAVSDRSAVVAACGAYEDIQDKTISDGVKDALGARNAEDFPEGIELCQGCKAYRIVPVISAGDILGGIYFLENAENLQSEKVETLCKSFLQNFFEQ